jgi:hypothetical protein
LRTIPASLFSKNGSPVPPVTEANFAATFKKQPVSFRVAAPPQTPPRMIIALDTSGSMKGNQKSTLDLAESLLSTVPQEAGVGLAFLAEDLQPVLLPTKDREGLKYQLEGLRIHPSSYRGRTALWDAIGKTVGMFGHPQLGDFLILISDGDDNRSKTSPEKVIHLLAAAGIRFFVAQLEDQFPYPVSRHQAPSPFQPQISRVAEATGGYVFNSISMARASLEKEYLQIINFYPIEINLPVGVDRPQEWKLNLVGLPKSQQNELVLTYPQVLVPCH